MPDTVSGAEDTVINQEKVWFHDRNVIAEGDR